MAWLRHRAGWAGEAVVAVAGALAVLGVLACVPLRAAGETAGSQGEAGAPPAGAPACPSSNPPSEMTLVAGTPQTALAGTAFATGLQVALVNSDGCPVTSGAAGISVTFSAPAAGASGVFSTSASSTVTVGADASGAVAAPPFTANGVAGSYTVTASSRYGWVSFSLTNAAAGVWCATLGRRVPVSAGEPVKLTAGVGSTQSTPAGARFPIRLAVTVTDAEGNAVPGALVTFSAPAAGASGRFTVRSRDLRNRVQAFHRRRLEVKADACGIAVAPAFTADDTRGGYVVEASVEHVRPATFALVNTQPGRPS
ncbi:MAG TPA: hypothetical protein VK790_09950 [Solirubrobacteraceae bacterium]|nr:hypothetical protein [Solirubrobacteraceae bacterium]